MVFRRLMRLAVPALGMLLTTGLVVQSGSLEGRLAAWTAGAGAASSKGADPVEPAPPSETPRVIAEGRVVAYPGAEVVVGTEATGRIVRFEVVEKSPVRKGDLIAELNADDLRAQLAEALARAAEAEADLRYFDREVHREESLIAKRAGTPQNLDASRRGLAEPRPWPTATGPGP